MGYRFSKGWDSEDNSWSTDDAAGSGCDASGTKSYHNGGVEGSSFAKWYDENLAGKFNESDDDAGSGGTKGSGSGGTKGSGSGGTKGSGSGGTKGSGSGGTKGSGSGGTKGSGSGGTKGSGSGGTKGSGSGGTKGSGSGGTKGSGSGGTKGSGSGGTKGSGSGGTKGSGSGGTKGSGSGGTKGSGSGGTKGSGSGGTKGSGSGGTKGSGSGGTKGSGSGGTKGSGSGGTKGSGSGGTKGSGSGGTKGSGSGGTKGSGSGGTQGTDTGGDDKTTLNFTVGDPAEINVSVTETDTGTLFFKLSQVQFDGNEAEIDEVYFNLTDGSGVETLYFFPTAGSRDVSDIQAADDGVNGAGGTFDVGLKFDPTAENAANGVKATDFTLSSHDGPLSFEDIDLAGMRVVVDVDESGEGDVLGVTGGIDPLDADPDDADTSESATALMDALSLTSTPSEEDEQADAYEDDAFDMA